MNSTLQPDMFNFEENELSLPLTSTPNRDDITILTTRPCNKPSCKAEQEKLLKTNARLSKHVADLLDELRAVKEENMKLQTEKKSHKNNGTTIEVSKQCQQAMRTVYNNLSSSSPGFNGFETNSSLATGFLHPLNQRVTQKVVSEMQSVYGLNGFNVGEVREACKRYYKSIKDKSTRINSGAVRKQSLQSKRSRILRKKCERRKRALTKVTSWTEATKSDVSKTLTSEYISSEEELEYPPSPFKEAGHVRAVRNLHWKSNLLSSRHSYLDKIFWEECASSKEKTSRTVILRDQSIYSDRPAPVNLPTWVTATSADV